MSRLVLINPNVNATTTEIMRGIAQEAAPPGVLLEAMTAPYGALLITNADALTVAADVVASLAGAILGNVLAGLIISAFGDPGLLRMRALLPCPVTGLAEAVMLEAATGERSFAIVTTTPDLAASIERTAVAYGHTKTFCGVALTKGDVRTVMSDPRRLTEALAEACADAIRDLRAEALVIGGGPLAQAAKDLAHGFPVPP